MTRQTRVHTGIAALLAASLVIAAAALWLRLRPDSEGRWVPLFENVDTSVLAEFARGIRSADSVELYEGFLWDRGKQEMVQRHGWYFYLPPIVPSDGDNEALRSLVLNEAAFTKWGGPKFCGQDFHPDWFIRWTSPDGGVHELHLCFGCR